MSPIHMHPILMFFIHRPREVVFECINNYDTALPTIIPMVRPTTIPQPIAMTRNANDDTKEDTNTGTKQQCQQ